MGAIEGDSLLALAHWRRTVAGMYADVRQATDPRSAWQQFVATRDQLFEQHPQSPLTVAQRAAFDGLPYFPYDPGFRCTGHLDYGIESAEYEIELGVDGTLRLTRIAAVRFECDGRPARLSLYWALGYGGGLFLPFRDLTNKAETFGGGRYLYDTIKGADLGAGERVMTLDFNFAYNPSCAYNAQWVCPLPPSENTIDVAVRAGEKKFPSIGNAQHSGAGE